MKTDYKKEIKDFLQNEKGIVGSKETLKNLKLGRVQKVFITANAPTSVKEEIMGFSKFAEIVMLDIDNEEFGTVCKRPYPISVLSIKKV